MADPFWTSLPGIIIRDRFTPYIPPSAKLWPESSWPFIEDAFGRAREQDGVIDGEYRDAGARPSG